MTEDQKIMRWSIGLASPLFLALLVWVGSAIYSLTDSVIRLQEIAKHSEKQIGRNSVLIERASLILSKVESSCSFLDERVDNHHRDIDILNTARNKGHRFTWSDGKELRQMYVALIRKIEIRLTRLENKMEKGEL